MDSGEHVREYYRKQGDVRTIERVIALLEKKAVEFIRHDSYGTWYDIESLIKLIEGEANGME